MSKHAPPYPNAATDPFNQVPGMNRPPMTAETDLLPCPWCGEKLASVSVSEGSTFRWRKVDGCCADGPEVRHDTMADDQAAAEAESRAAAIAAWNRRAQSAEIEALRAEVERLRAELVRLEKIAGYGGLASDAPERMILASEVYDGMQSCDKWCEVRRVIDDGQPMPESATPYVRADRAERLAEALRNSSDALERLAFAIRAPNAHTPQLVELAIAMRAAALHPAAAQEGKESFWPKLPGSGGPDWTGHD